MKKLLSFFFILGAIALAATAAMAQSVIDTTLVNPSDPASIVAAPATNALTYSVTVILTFLSLLIPGIKNIKAGVLRAAVTGFVVILGAATWKFGFFTEDSLQYLLSGLLPNFAYSGVIWEILKFLLGKLGVDVKAIQPGALPAKE